MAYGDLTEGERAHWDEYTNLRGISDWPGFTDGQDKRRADSRKWLEDRRTELWHDLNDEPVNEAENEKNKRRQRYDQLHNDKLNGGSPKHEVTLPCSGSATDTEKVFIEEREVYLAFGSTTDAQKARKIANSDWLVARRKELWHLMEDDPDGNKANDRQKRYDNLCIATHHGSAYEEWDKTHNKWGQAETPDRGPESGGSGRSGAVSNAKGHVGVSENPANSNRGAPEPDGWQKRVYGSSGVPWCACFTTCMAWDAGVKGSATAAVQNNINMAKQGQGMYRGYTGDRSRVRAGDHVAIGCSSCHIGMLAADPPSSGNIQTVEGNTSPGSSGSQYNGGCVATRSRAPSEITGYLLVRFED